MDGFAASVENRTLLSTVTQQYTYIYADGELAGMSIDDLRMTFTYDEKGSPATIDYNGTRYFYVTNIQGDVVAILNSSGTKVVEYTYDAWGNPISVTGSMSETLGQHNPLRYRGYVYDTETGLYYLQSRYYNPEMGRFINIDISVSTGQGFSGNNTFVYCGNNPVIRVDVSGYAFETIFDVITLGFSIAEVAMNPYDPMAWIGLAGDVVDIIPFVTGVGETVRGLRFIDKAGDVLEIAETTDNTIDTYRNLKKISGKSEEVHHIVEKRFIKSLNVDNVNDMMSIVLTKSKHREFTNAWRLNISYGRKGVTKLEIFQAAAKVYGDDPQLMGAVVQTIFRKVG